MFEQGQLQKILWADLFFLIVLDKSTLVISRVHETELSTLQFLSVFSTELCFEVVEQGRELHVLEENPKAMLRSKIHNIKQ